MDQLTSMQVFQAVVDNGSFAQAGERLGISAPMVSKHVAQLEQRLGARLLNRSSRHVSLTEAGQRWYAQSRLALEMLDAAAQEIGQHNQAPSGQLKISAPVWCATPQMARILARYRARYPQVLVDIHLDNHKIDLATAGYDMALRASSDPAPHLIARPLCQVPFYLVASPAYLAQAGSPQQPADLAQHLGVLPSYVSLSPLQLSQPGGRSAPLHVQPALLSDDSNLSLHAVRAGMGLGFLPSWLVEDDLRSGQLQRVLPQWDALTVTLYAIYTSRRYLAPKVRSFIDCLSQEWGGAGSGAAD
ncbi:LysR family transcriptional regulator [Comamonas sediminis]|uniref:LysR family transcriptional regulator n=1 Tax=Comamonas sediminis TaxID=1783360 RepID=UPI003D2C8FD7